jgi:hypothetical protein
MSEENKPENKPEAKAEAKADDPNRINSIEWITERELKAMPEAECRITRERMTTRQSKIDREMYFADIYFDKTHTVSHHVNLSAQQWGPHRDVSRQVLRARSIRIDLPRPNHQDELGRETFRLYALDVYFNEKVKMSFNLNKTDFLALYQVRLEKGLIDKKYAPLERTPGKAEASEEEKADLDEKAAF